MAADSYATEAPPFPSNIYRTVDFVSNDNGGHRAAAYCVSLSLARTPSEPGSSGAAAERDALGGRRAFAGGG